MKIGRPDPLATDVSNSARRSSRFARHPPRQSPCAPASRSFECPYHPKEASPDRKHQPVSFSSASPPPLLLLLLRLASSDLRHPPHPGITTVSNANNTAQSSPQATEVRAECDRAGLRELNPGSVMRMGALERSEGREQISRRGPPSPSMITAVPATTSLGLSAGREKVRSTTTGLTRLLQTFVVLRCVQILQNRRIVDVAARHDVTVQQRIDPFRAPKCSTSRASRQEKATG